MRKSYRVASGKVKRLMPFCFRHAMIMHAFLFFILIGYVKAADEPNPEKLLFAPQADCNVFQENNGLVVIQAESRKGSGWAKKSDGGNTYLEWTGAQSFNNTSKGRMTYKINFKNPGYYRFVWRNTIKKGNDVKEHNDSWLKFPNNSNIVFFGHDGAPGSVGADLKAKKNVVFPRGTGMSPEPNGASKDGWLKVYINSNRWRWVANTSDHDSHKVYVYVKKAGTYDMQVAGRSTGHAIDGIIMYHLGKQGGSLAQNTLDKILKSVKDCSDTPIDPDPNPDPDPEPDNKAPVITGIPDKSVVEGNTLKVDVKASDANNDVIDLSIVVKRGSNIVPAKDYSFVIKNNGKLGEFTLPTQKGDAGKLNVTVTASDGKAEGEEKFAIQINKADEPDPAPDPDPDPTPGDEKITIYAVDAVTNKNIKELTNNSSFEIGVVGLKAVVSGVKPNGVKFILKGGPDNMTHKNSEGAQAPYSAFGDIGVKINPWPKIKVGNYTLTVEVGGSNLSKTIKFSVKGDGAPDPGPDPDPDPDPKPGDDDITVYVVDAVTNKNIKSLENNSSFGIGVVGLKAVVNGKVPNGVKFILKGGPDNMNYKNSEGSQPPYSVFGDKGVDVNPWPKIKVGKYTLTVEVRGNNMAKTINFNVTDGVNPDPDPNPDPIPSDKDIQVIKLFLINPSTNKRVRELQDGITIANQNWNVEAVTNPGQVGSVVFDLNGEKNFRTENVVPYALVGDVKGQFGGTSLQTGKNTIVATPYKKGNGNGEVGEPMKVTFTVGNNARVANVGADKTDSSISADELYADFKVARVYPNPVAEELTLEYTGVHEEGSLAFSLISRLGVEHKLGEDAYYIDGSTVKVNMTGQNLSAGVYILKVENQQTGNTELYRLIKY